MRPDWLCSLLLLAGLSFQEAVVPQRMARTEGVVLRADGRTPIPGVRIYLQRQTAGGSGDFATLTGSDGRFALKDIPPGRYKLIARLTGFMTTEYGANRPS